ncbi:MAG: hypothetical protein Aurels2KO_31970 [Aureliella sp.]
MHGDQLVADYLTMSKSKPILWPLNGPGGTAMTRAYPMVADSKDEAHDHPHHRSLWFTHGEVNGTDFWLEGGEGGITEHQKFTILESGDESAVVAARNIWETAGGEPVLTEERKFTFSHDKGAVILDCEFVVHATHGDVNFGDTKEGTFGIRIAESMKVDAKLGGVLTNSEGATNKDAWGKAAAWVDYVGPIGDKTMGIAILCHPSTYNYPNRWHVRTYGLFAANPFGVHHFLKQPEPTKGVDLAEGKSFTFRYRVICHEGDTTAADIEGRNAEYAKMQL